MKERSVTQDEKHLTIFYHFFVQSGKTDGIISNEPRQLNKVANTIQGQCASFRHSPDSYLLLEKTKTLKQNDILRLTKNSEYFVT